MVDTTLYNLLQASLKKKKLSKDRHVTSHVARQQKRLLRYNQGIVVAQKLEAKELRLEKTKNLEIAKKTSLKLRPVKHDFLGNHLGEKHNGRYLANSKKSRTPSFKLDPRVKSSAVNKKSGKKSNAYGMRREVHMDNIFGKFDSGAYYSLFKGKK